MIAFKLFRVRKDGTIGPLFINKKQRIAPGEWIDAESHPTKGFAVRAGWHCTHSPKADHLKMKEDRAWFKVEIKDFALLQRPSNQGGLWYLANKLKVIERL